MRKVLFVAVIAVLTLCFSASAFAGTLKPGDKTSCVDAKEITLEASGNSSAGDRANANAVIWKSSNATTIPISLGPGENYGFEGERKVGMADKHSMGRKVVTLTHQNNFSRGDSIGDISGEVRITNNGTVDLVVNCK
ncbi:hypothetical protein [Nitrospina watsonii]|uniref:Uncharacterized protein n=1 Tax=Nitrospina watsonii TaxID=1323948 RepID=A0ABN8VYW2_9BACT|nr:hypothetical protein [Nitrospina watsonii]CAI2718463.1 conserved exported protein of unknown function [Nitrospina watsonii]